MILRILIRQHPKRFLVVSVSLILLAVLIIIFYFYQTSSPPAPLPPVIGGDAADKILTEAQAGNEFLLTLVFIILGLVILGVFFFSVFRVMKKTQEEHPELLNQ